jgi:hypothetical protein
MCNRNKILLESVRKVNDAASGARSLVWKIIKKEGKIFFEIISSISCSTLSLRQFFLIFGAQKKH